MPGYRVHLLGGLATFLGSMFLISKFSDRTSIDFFTLLQWGSFCLLGSLFPDIDTKSKGQSLFYKMMFLCLVLLFYKKKMLLFVGLSFVSLAPLLVRHRGFFHRAWFLIFMPLSLALVVQQLFPAYEIVFLYNTFFFIAGALSHIILDKVPYLSK